MSGDRKVMHSSPATIVRDGDVNGEVRVRCTATICGNSVSNEFLHVYFGVPLTSVTIHGDTKLKHGVAAQFQCVTSVARPIAAVEWYIDEKKITSGVSSSPTSNGSPGRETYIENSTMSFTPSYSVHHNKRIYCRAKQGTFSVRSQTPDITLNIRDTIDYRVIVGFVFCVIALFAMTVASFCWMYKQATQSRTINCRREQEKKKHDTCAWIAGGICPVAVAVLVMILGSFFY